MLHLISSLDCILTPRQKGNLNITNSKSSAEQKLKNPILSEGRLLSTSSEVVRQYRLVLSDLQCENMFYL
jgi:hypothetical protein